MEEQISCVWFTEGTCSHFIICVTCWDQRRFPRLFYFYCSEMYSNLSLLFALCLWRSTQVKVININICSACHATYDTSPIRTQDLGCILPYSPPLRSAGPPTGTCPWVWWNRTVPGPLLQPPTLIQGKTKLLYIHYYTPILYYTL